MKQLVLFVFFIASCFSVYSKDSLKDHSPTTAKPPTTPSKIRLVSTIDPRKGTGSAKKNTSSTEPIKSLRGFSTQPQSGSSIGPLPTLKGMTIRKPIGPDPIRFTMRSSKNPVNLGEEVEITLTAELLPILPSQLFFFDQQKTFRLKLLLPKGAQQTGGTYFDLIGETLKPDGLNQITYTWRGTITSGDSTGCFRLLREVSSASDQALFIEKSQLCIQVGDPAPKDSVAVQPKADVSTSKARTSACSAPRVSWAGNSTTISLSWVAEDNPGFTSSDAPATLQAQTCSGTTNWYKRQADNTGLQVASGNSYTYVTHNYIAAQDVTYRYYATCVCADGESAPSADFSITITRKAITLIPTSTTACGDKHIYTPLTVQGCPAGSIIRFYTSGIFSWTMASTGSPYIYDAYGGVQEDTYQATCIYKGVEGPRSNSAIITANCITDPCAEVSTPNTPTIHQYGNALTNLNVCYDGGLNLVADGGCTGTIKWYRQSDNAEMATGTTYNPDHIQQSVNYYATCSNNCHTSSTSNLIIITVLTQANTPAIHQTDHNTITNISICPNNTVSLTADGCEGTVVWYNQSGVEVGQGSSIGPNVASSNSYYAKCVNSCTTSGPSNSVNITVINTVPPVIHQNGSSLTSLTICPTQLVGLLADPGCQGTVVWYNQSDTYVAEGPTFNPSPTASVSYYTRCVNSCTTSGPSNSVNITVINTVPPVIHQNGSSLTSLTICPTQLVGLLADPGCQGTVVWYNQSDTYVAEGPTFNPSPTASVSYYTRCVNSCTTSGPSNSVNITVINTVPPVIHQNGSSLTSLTICPTQLVGLLADPGCQGTVVWYNQSGTYVAEGPTFNPSPTASVSYYTRCVNSCTTSGPSNSVNITVINTVPPVIHQNGSSLTSLTICPTQLVGLLADPGCQGTVVWYNQSDTYVAEGPTFNPSPTASVSYYTRCVNSCTTSGPSNSVNITVLITPTSTPPTASGVSVCSGGVASLTASGCANYYWYNGSGQLVATSGSSFTTPALSANTNYFVRCQNPCGASDERVIPITITTAPTSTPPTASGVSVCSGGVASLTASGCANYYWYNGSGQLVATSGSSFTTPALSANTNYFVRCQNPCGASDERVIPITITAAPTSTPPTASGVSVCSGGVASLTASGCANYYWYNGSGQLVATSGSSFTTPALSANTNYFVRCQNPCGASDERVIPITITTAPTSTPPTASGVSVCSGGVASLTASGCANYYWYNGSGQLVATSGSSFTTPALSANTNYFVRCQNPCGASDERVIPITITTAPTSTPPTASGVSVCAGGVASLTASGCANYYWYNGSGQLVATSGSSFTTPALSANTNYFVRCQNPCGASDERVITVMVINTVPPVIHQNGSSLTSLTICPTQLVGLLADPGCQGTVVWYNQSDTYVAEGPTFNPSPTASVSYYTRCVNSCTTSGPSNSVNITVINTVPPVIHQNGSSLTSLTICPTQLVGLLADPGCQGTVVWYNQSDTYVAEGPTFNPSPTASVSYYTRCVNSCTTSGPSNSVNITVINTVPPVIHQNGSSLTSLTICPTQLVGLLADPGCQGTVVWYNQSDTYVAEGPTFNPSPTASVSYYTRCVNSCTTSGPSNSMNITVINTVPPVIHQNGSSLTSLTICPTQLVGLLADPGCQGTVVWYNQSGTYVAEGPTFNPSPTASVSYYTRCVNSCTTSGPSNSVNITVINTVPPVIHQNGSSLTSLTICPTQLVGLLADPGCQGTVVWYNQSDTYVAEGPTFNPSPTASVSYYTRCVNSCTTSGPSNSVNITVLITPTSTPPTASGVSVCSGGVASLTASGCANYYWYNGSGQLVATSGSSFTTPALSANTNYFVRCQNPCGASDERVIPITITTAPTSTPPTASGVSVCSGGVASLTASGCANYYWYNGSGQLVATSGSSFTTPALSANTNYFVRCQNPCGASDERVIPISILSVSNTPTLTARVAGTSSAQSLTLIASGCPTGSTVKWSGPNNTTATGSSWIIASFTQTSTYSAQCQSSTACPSSAQITVNYVIPSTPIIRTTATQVCAGQSVTLTADGCQAGTTVLWSGEQTGASLILTPTATATYRAYCVVGEVTGDPSTQLGVTVLSSHTVTISGSQTYAVGETISLSAVSSASGSVTYRWTGPNNLNATTQNLTIPTATTAMSGTYTVVATNANSCTATATYALSVAASDISCSCQDCDAPEWQTDVIAVGNANTGSTYNSVVVDTYLSPTSSVGGTTERSQQIAYLDGFGRPLQMIQTGASPTGKDVVAPVAYDGFGRVTKNYLPYTDAAGGSFKNNALTAQAGFYSGLKGDAAAYAETLLDASPLQRITQQGSIGADWQPDAADANKTGVIKANYRISSETTIPKLVFAYSGTTWTLSRYAARQLFVNETKDANNNTVVAFTDILGQTVCKKVYNGTDVLTTYYAYDDFGRLCLTFPPKAAQKLESQADGAIDFTTTAAFKDQIYWYVYDARGRVVEKKTADATIEEMVYNLHDQVVLYRNGLHRKQNRWLYSKYDELGRMVRKGVYASANSRTAEQTNVNNSFAPAPVFGDLAYPTTGLTELSRSYYDDYAFTPKKSPDQPTEFGLGTLATEAGPVNLIGKLTGTQETVLKASGATATAKTTLLTTYYYDQYGRQVQTRQENHLSSEDLSSVRLDFAGRVLETKLTTSAYSKTTSVWTRNTYTRNNQLKMTCQRINDGIKEPVGRYSYNELGEMTEKWQGCKMQVITYQTDIRGRLTGINSSDPVQLKANKQFFGLKLEYSLDDNISAQEWGSLPNLRTGATLPAKRRYDYTYDPIGRIKGASYSGGTNENFSVSGINYDLNGNLLSMNRRVQTPTLTDSPNEDQLSYAYAPNSNQLRNVQDAGVATPTSPKKAHYFNDRNQTADDGIRTGFTATDDYAYDEAGNLVRDLNRDIRSIDYNVLGLPETITFGNQTKIYYLYTGGGDKLQKQGAYLPTNQAGQYAQKQIDYAGGLVYTEQAISFIPTAEGRALPPVSGATTTDYRYEYQQTDQLGNLRSACRCGEKFDANGNLVPTTGSEDPRTVVQENHFDPWGLNLADIETQPGSNTDLWQFTGQERDYQAYTEFKLRQYDATLGRFTSVDPMADAFSNISPFNYADNSPIANIDLYGLQAVPISKLAQAEADGLGIFLNGGSVMYNIAPGMSQVVNKFASEFAGAIGNNLLGMATAVMHPIETTKAVGRSVGETLIDWSYRSPNMPMCGGCPNPNYSTLEGKARQQQAIRDLNETIADIKAHPGTAAGNTAFFVFGPKVFGKIGGKVSSLASRLEIVPNTLGSNFGNLRLGQINKLSRNVDLLRGGEDVYVSSVKEARQLLAEMPDLRPHIDKFPGWHHNATPNKWSKLWKQPSGTYRGDLINTSDPFSNVIHESGSIIHDFNAHYNIRFHNGTKAAIIIK